MANRKDAKKVFTDINEILDIVMDIDSGAEYGEKTLGKLLF